MVMLESCCLCRDSSVLYGISLQPGHLHANINWCCPRGECAIHISGSVFQLDSCQWGELSWGTEQIHTKWDKLLKWYTLNPWLCRTVVKPLRKAKFLVRKSLCNVHVCRQTEGCFKSIQSWLNSGLFIFCTGLPGWAKAIYELRAARATGTRNFYPCLLHQVFVHIILLMASVKERNDVPSPVKESFRFRHWTESWALFWGHHCSAAHLERVCSLRFPDYVPMGAELHLQSNGERSRQGSYFCDLQI